MLRRLLNERLFRQFGNIKSAFEQTLFLDRGLYFTRRVTRPPRCVLHLEAAWLAEDFMPNIEGRAQREAGVARGGLDEDAFEGRRVEDLSVSDTIERHAASEAERFGSSVRIQR